MARDISPAEVEQDVAAVETPPMKGLKVPRNLFVLIGGAIISVIVVLMLTEADKGDKADAAKAKAEDQEAVTKSIEMPASLADYQSASSDQQKAADQKRAEQAAGAAANQANYPLPPAPPRGYPAAGPTAADGEALKSREKIASADIMVFGGGSSISGQDSTYQNQPAGYNDQQRVHLENEARMAAARAAADKSQQQAMDQLGMMMKGQQQPQGQMSLTPAEENAKWLAEQTSKDNPAIRALPPRAGYTLPRGTVVPAVTLMDISSDIAGDFSAMVSEDVYDPKGRLIIPRGSKLFGAYNSGVKVGQSKVMVAFTWLYLPSGAQIPLNGMQGADSMGIAGLSGDVDNHFLKMFGSAFAIGAIDRIANGTTSGIQSAGYGSTTTQGGMTQILVNTANSILQRNQNIPPTVNIPNSTPFNMIIRQDISVDPGYSTRK